MYRPEAIAQIFGQDHIQDALAAWVEDKSKIPKSLLLAGPYGTGKTTVARILAKELISVGKDLKEINAADARGIDDVRQWAESTRYAPFGNAKVYIIDELHQMTKAAQSALLKVIEEPPPRVYFFLCTMEPHMLLPAIQSRCTILHLKLFEEQDTIALLKFIHKNLLPVEVLQAIHKKSKGHARDAVKMADVAVETGVMNVDDLDKNIGYGVNFIHTIVNAILQKKCGWSDAIKLLHIENEQSLGYVLDDKIDEAAEAGYEPILSNYYELLNVRLQRKEYKITAKEQVLHFLSKVYKFKE